MNTLANYKYINNFCYGKENLIIGSLFISTDMIKRIGGRKITGKSAQK
jgi:hypothetical protein